MGGITCGNFYIHSGTDSISRGKRENKFAEVVTQLMINHKQNGYIGGDLKSITKKKDATQHPDSKIG